MKVSEKFIDSYIKLMRALVITLGLLIVLYLLEFETLQLTYYNFLVFGLGGTSTTLLFFGINYKRFLAQHWEFEDKPKKYYQKKFMDID